MVESEYTKLPIPHTGYDNAGFICSIYEYQNFQNPKAERKYETADGKPVRRLSENKFQIIETGIVIHVNS